MEQDKPTFYDFVDPNTWVAEQEEINRLELLLLEQIGTENAKLEQERKEAIHRKIQQRRTNRELERIFAEAKKEGYKAVNIKIAVDGSITYQKRY